MVVGLLRPLCLGSESQLEGEIKREPEKGDGRTDRDKEEWDRGVKWKRRRKNKENN